MLYRIPESWTDQGLLARPITLETTVLRALIFHAAMVLATKHPNVGDHARRIVEDMLDHLEAMFEANGLEPPAHGWRGQAAQVCRHCGCTEDEPCWDPLTGWPCHWVEEDLCSVCAPVVGERRGILTAIRMCRVSLVCALTLKAYTVYGAHGALKMHLRCSGRYSQGWHKGGFYCECWCHRGVKRWTI